VAAGAQAQPTLSKVFVPSAIGPGSVSTATLTLANNTGGPVTDLAFTDSLPMAITIADPAFASTTCALAVGGALSAPAGGSTISLSDAVLPNGGTCTVTVDVTASTPGAHTNPAVTLSSSAGSSDSAAVDLTVDAELAGFSKSFAPAAVDLGGRSTLTFTIDNSANASLLAGAAFTDPLPAGLEVAGPANATTDCSGPLGLALVATPGTSTISFDADGSGLAPGFEVLGPGEICTVSVDVVATAGGSQDNGSEELLGSYGTNPSLLSSGAANASLDVTVTPLALTKSFLDDPVAPGGAVTLEFRIFNFNRSDAASDLAFSDDLAATLTGLTFSSLLLNDCGGTVNGVGTTNLALSGGSLGPGGSCTVRASLAVPSGSAPGVYPNTTSAVTGVVGGSPVVGNMASENLYVEPVPVIVKEFVDDPVNPGDTVELEFTITNTSTTSGATGIAFQDIFDTILPTASVTPGNGCCGAGSTCTFNAQTPGSASRFTLSNGSLAAAGMAGDSCTFSLTLDVDGNAPGGTYPNTTSPVSATVDGLAVSGVPASDDLVVVSAPSLVKVFTDDPALPGGTVTLEFTLTHPAEAPGAATNITFTDDLAATLSGLTALLPPSPDPPCGAGSSLSGSAGNTFLTLSGGSLLPGEECTFTVPLSVPAMAALGTYPNTTSGVTADVGGAAATSAAASDDLVLSGLSFTKEFLGNPVIPGDTVILRFTITNLDPDLDATDISFTDDLGDVLPGTPDLSVVTALPASFCGGTMSLIGTDFLAFSGGTITSGAPPCVIDLTLQVPVGVASNVYSNVTSSLTADLDGPVVVAPANDDLEVDGDRLVLTKEFTDDPVSPGSSANLRFTLTNLDPARAASDVAFTDGLDAVLAGLTASGLPFAACGGTVDGIPDSSVVDFSGGSLAGGADCSFDVTVQVPAGADAGDYPNTTGSVSGLIDGLAVSGDPATGTLSVLGQVSFRKSFAGPTVAGGTAVLTFTLINGDASPIDRLVFSDDLDAVIPGLVATNLPLSDPCGSGSQVSGTSTIELLAGSLPASGGTCSFDVELAVPVGAAPGTFGNTTSDLRSFGVTVAPAATADLMVEPPPEFSKSFSPTVIPFSGTSTLIFQINNTGSVLAASGLDFTDNLPAGLVVATPAGASTTCTGGTLTAVAGSGVITYSGGTVEAGVSCQVQVEVSPEAADTFLNVTGNLVSSSGNSGTASATLEVIPPEVSLAKAFLANPVLPGGTVEVRYTVTNSSASLAATAISFSDDLDAALSGLVATGLPQSDVCGAGSQVAGTSLLTLTGGSVAAGSSCSFTVTLQVPAGAAPGSYPGATSLLSWTAGGVGLTGPPASDTLEVASVGFTKAFSDGPGVRYRLTFSLTNPDNVNAISGLTFSDDLDAVLPGMEALGLPENGVCGFASTLSGTSVVTLTDGSLAPGGSCTFEVLVSVPAGTVDGTYTNVTTVLEGVVGGSPVVANPVPAEADLETAPVVPIPVGGPAGLLFLALLLGGVAVRFIRLG